MLGGMSSEARTQPRAIRKAEKGKVTIGEDSADLCLLVDEGTSQPIGVHLKVMFGPYATSPNDFFAKGTNSWKSFKRAELEMTNTGKLILVVHEEETNPHTIPILDKLLSAWSHPASAPDKEKLS
jgi:hypothetical protein